MAVLRTNPSQTGLFKRE
jgi:hypothetical protein